MSLSAVEQGNIVCEYIGTYRLYSVQLTLRHWGLIPEACQEMLISHSQLVMALLSLSLTVQMMLMWCRYYLFWAVEM